MLQPFTNGIAAVACSAPARTACQRALTCLVVALVLLTAASAARAQQGEPSSGGAAADCSRDWDGGAGSETEYKSWLHPLSAEQALTAEVGQNELAFPKKGNPWLPCIQKYDVLWSFQTRDFDHLFVRRVLEITEEPNRMIFRTKNTGLFTVSSGKRAASEREDPLVTELNAQLPSKLPGLPTRGYFRNEGGGPIVAYSAVYSGVSERLAIGFSFPNTERMEGLRSEHEKQAAQQANTRKEARGGRTVYVKNEDMATSLTLFLDGVVLSLTSDSLPRLYATLDTLDLDALEALAAER